MTTRMQQRLGTATRWTEINPILASGEMGVETDTNKFKLGDGETTWSNLPYHLSENDIPDVTALVDAAMQDVQTAISNAVSTAVSGLVDSAPAALNTLNELAAAIADDATFANTITNAIANKADIVHSHTKSEITDFAHTHQYADISGVAASSHTHTYSDISGVAPAVHTHTTSDIVGIDSLAITSSQVTTPVATISSSYTTQASDNGKLLLSTASTATTITISNTLTEGQSFAIFQSGAGIVSIAAGSGVTIQGAGLSGVTLAINDRYSGATVFCISSGVYAILGNVSGA